MIYARPAKPFTAVLDASGRTGLVGTLTVQIEAPDGSTLVAATTAGITEVEPGIYAAALTAPSAAATYIVVWNDPGVGRAPEELVVSATITETLGFETVTDPSALTFSYLVNQLRAAEGAGFDISEDQAGGAINESLKRLAGITKWLEEEIELGPTVAGQDVYQVSDRILDLADLDVAGTGYERVNQRMMRDLKVGRRFLKAWVPGVYSPRFTSTGIKEVGLYPAPDTDGLTIGGFAAVLPGDFSGDDPVPFPLDLKRTILDGAKVPLYQEIDENPDMAELYEQRFLRTAEDLRRRRNSRIGSGPSRIRMVA